METDQIARVAIQSQYLAALAMLREVIKLCPEGLWLSTGYKNRLWHVAYHALFYTHLYLQISEKNFKPWEHHRTDYEFLGPQPWPPYNLPTIGEPYSREEVLAYLSLCEDEVRAQVPMLDLAGPSGFSWQNFSKLELQFYNIRHLQQHVGELSDRLGVHAGIELPWF